ncbi:unnamed protein product [Rangifer tarandus platyrhynchus]|uniref:Uncharacterized protein n=1 Tax=Rangifer tarandus platyrhynchus TaxID=3082113 RepID=A0ABN8XV95_RANTA|nr:unnamed protein product [Rangifer tarandus platyrhynchus]
MRACPCLGSKSARCPVPVLSQPGTMDQTTPTPRGSHVTIFRPLSQKRIFHSQHNGCPTPLSSSDQGICLPKNISHASTLWASLPCSSPFKLDITSWGCYS